MHEIRPIEPRDAEGLVGVWRATWPATYAASLGPAATDAMLSELETKGAAGLVDFATSHGFCAVNGTEIVATAIFSRRNDLAFLWGMYVKPAHQRAGIGAGLLDAVRQAVRPRPIEVRVLRASLHAKHFYRKQGFRTVGHEKTQVMPGIEADCLVMRDTRQVS